jgi:hypothetical protein
MGGATISFEIGLSSFAVPRLGSVDLYRSTAWVLLSGPHLFLPRAETVSQYRSWFESLTTNGIA